MSASAGRSPRRADTLSKERIIAAAIEILDAEGENALTFRSLAAALSTGPGAIYWHLTDKNELLAATADVVIAEVTGAAPRKTEPREEIRAVALALFDAIDAHPWVGAQLLRQNWRLTSTRILEAIGSRLIDLGVPVEARFDLATALMSYIVGVAGQNAANARNAPHGMTREAFLADLAEGWGELDEAEFPFVREIAARVPEHDDREQFVAGIDVFLAGIPERGATASHGVRGRRPTGRPRKPTGR